MSIRPWSMSVITTGTSRRWVNSSAIWLAISPAPTIPTLPTGRAKRPAGAPDKSLARPVGKVGIVGAGLMASQMALLFTQRLEVPVVMTDIDQGRIDMGVDYVRAEIDKLAAKGRVSRD